MNSNKRTLYLFLLALMYTSTAAASGDHGHEAENTGIAATQHEVPAGENHGHEEAGEKDGHGHEEENTVHLNDEQRRTAGIMVETLEPKPVADEIEAPGEVTLNTYATSQITPRIEAQVVERYARLGDEAKKGQPLVLLSSATMAEAQGTLLLAAKEWQRVKKLGKKVVSEQRYLESRITYQQAYSRLLAYGMTEKQANRLVSNSAIGKADGSFTLLSPQNGTVIRDDFIVGQMVQPGDLLFEITDESTIWVEARINPAVMWQVHIGATVRILSGNKWVSGKVVQIHHALDEVTRTMAVRLEIPNPGDHLHPGQFVTARIETGQSGKAVLSLPADAVMRSPDGDWQVFVEKEPGEYEPVEVEVVRQLPGLVIIEGLKPGTRVVTKGAFFVQSELAKSGFAVHNH
ncbi:efflux RND transporter periplasmic adaptor subunit [Thiolapillus sp.]|uniref:efflux RND transporter periplasmic adaptor subunit n=1 Tax=Thiolapillus sp. TaxID=2017437 RepID=UPI003AF9B6A5